MDKDKISKYLQICKKYQYKDILLENVENTEEINVIKYVKTIGELENIYNTYHYLKIHGGRRRRNRKKNKKPVTQDQHKQDQHKQDQHKQDQHKQDQHKQIESLSNIDISTQYIPEKYKNEAKFATDVLKSGVINTDTLAELATNAIPEKHKKKAKQLANTGITLSKIAQETNINPQQIKQHLENGLQFKEEYFELIKNKLIDEIESQILKSDSKLSLLLEEKINSVLNKRA
jgi:hypothetical protein